MELLQFQNQDIFDGVVHVIMDMNYASATAKSVLAVDMDYFLDHEGRFLTARDKSEST